MTQIFFAPVSAIGGATTSVDLPDFAPDIYKMDTTTSPKNILIFGTTSGGDFSVEDGGAAVIVRKRRVKINVNTVDSVVMIALRYRAVGELVRT